MVPIRERPDDGESDGNDPPAAGSATASGTGTTEGERVSGEAFTEEEAKSGEIDARAHAAWRSWLGALASDPNAAMAAALAYESLPAQARDAWLEALDTDAPGVRVPKVALYAPLLAVERDATRRARIERALHASPGAEVPSRAIGTHALRGTRPNGDHVCIVVSPLYLDFVELLVCCYGEDGIASARHEPLSHLREEGEIPEAEGISLELTPLSVVVEDLAHAVLADRRAGREPAEALGRFTHLFAASLPYEDG
jgi:hypothetical protein